MKLPVSVEAWWNSQGGEIARREMAWARGWMVSREGITLVGTLVISLVAMQVLIQFMVGATSGLSSSGPPPSSLNLSLIVLPLIMGVISLVSLVLYCVLFVRLLRLRIWSLFGGHRLRDMLLSGIDGTSLWPALLFGPAVVWGTIFLMSMSGEFLIWIFTLVTGGDVMLFYEPTGEESARESIGALTKFWAMGGRWLATPFYFAFSVFSTATITAFGARLTLFRPRALQALGSGLLCVILIALPGLVLSADSFFPGTPAISDEKTFLMFFLSPLLGGLITVVIFWSTLRSLRSEKLWNKLRKHVESL